MARKALVVIVWKAKAESQDRKVLVLKVIPERGGFWQPVTGKVDEGESYAEAALRESEEETGLHFERLPQYLGMEYSFEGRHGHATERAFFLPILGGEEPPKVKIDPKEHTEFRWVSPQEALQLVHFPSNQKAIERAAAGVPPLFLSKQGTFFQEGEELQHERTVELLHKSLQRSQSGHFSVRIDREELDVVVEGTARFVRSYDRNSGELLLSDGTRQTLRPETLEFHSDNSLQCSLENGWKARFLSPAYYEITKDLEEGSSNGEYVLNFLGRKHHFRVPH